MALNRNFSMVTGAAPTVTSLVSGSLALWATYYTNGSGILRFVHPNTTDYVASTFYPETGVKDVAGISNVTTGHITFTAGVNTVVYGASGNNLNTLPTVLGEPNFWIKAFGPNGQLLSIPAYTRTA